jgi:hypothetical protein
MAKRPPRPRDLNQLAGKSRQHRTLTACVERPNDRRLLNRILRGNRPKGARVTIVLLSSWRAWKKRQANHLRVYVRTARDQRLLRRCLDGDCAQGLRIRVDFLSASLTRSRRIGIEPRERAQHRGWTGTSLS